MPVKDGSGDNQMPEDEDIGLLVEDAADEVALAGGQSGAANGGDLHQPRTLSSLTSALLWDRGAVCCLVAAVFYSATPVFVKLLKDTPVFEVAMARSGISLPSTLAIVGPPPLPFTPFIHRTPFPLTRRAPWIAANP